MKENSRPMKNKRAIAVFIIVLLIASMVIASNVDVITRWIFADLPPSINLSNPTDDLVLDVNTTEFNWTSSDPEGETVYHVYYVDIDDSFTSPLKRVLDVGTSLNVTPDPFEDGNWYWRVEATDGTNINTSETWHFVIQTNVSNHIPTLSDGSVFPLTGNQMTIFTYSVNFTDSDNNSASYVNVSINGIQHTMSEYDAGDTDTSDGKIFTYSTTLSPGTYNYSFICSDGTAVNWSSITEGYPIVSYTTPHAPMQSNPYPYDGETYVPVPPANVSITVNDVDAQLMDIYFYRYSGGSWILFDTITDVYNGTYNSSTTDWVTSFGTTYQWSVNVTDGTYWTNISRNFTTDTIRIYNEYPENESWIFSNQPTLIFTISNPTGNLMNYTIYTGNSTSNCTAYLTNASLVGNGTYHCINYFNATSLYVPYYWRIYIEDGTLFVNRTMYFTVTTGGGMLMGRDTFVMVLAFAGIMFAMMGIILALYYRKKQ